MIVSISSLRKLVLFALLALAFAGCGGDDDDQSASTPQATAPSTSETTPPATTEVDPGTETLPNDGDGNGLGTSEPETQIGGAGDEVPAATMALFTGSNGRITPRVVRVPAYISVLVSLRGADDAGYSLTFGDKTVRVSPGLSSAGTRLAGLRPGAKLVGQATTGDGTPLADVTISATAEPGP
jgi:hypothetical protein